MKKDFWKVGFTLIEMLVVVFIVSLVSGLLFLFVDSARASSRDAVRLSDMRQINTAAFSYYQEKGTIPNSLNDLVRGGYLSSMPVDPKTGEQYNCVVLNSNGKKVFIVDTSYETKIIKNLSGESVYEKVGIIIGDVDISKICTLSFTDDFDNEVKLDYPLCINGILKDQVVGINDPREESGGVSTSTSSYEWSDRLTPAKWRDAFVECSNLGTGWVLPNIDQLTNGIINNKVDTLYQYWSRDKVTDPNYPNMAISVYYADAPGYPANHIANSWDNINTEYNVRCIKSGELIGIPLIYDYEWSNNMTAKWEDAFISCSNLGTGWVLPSKEQLSEALIYNKFDRGLEYWSRDYSSSYPNTANGVYYVVEYGIPNNIAIDNSLRDTVYNVRCIKSGESIENPPLRDYEWSDRLTPAKWRDAFVECSNLGTGWVLPSASQLIDGQRKNKVDGLYEYWSRDKVTDSNYPNMAIGVGSASQYWEDININYNVQCIKTGEIIETPRLYDYEWSNNMTAKWEDAFISCSNLGTGWVLPSKEQLSEALIYNLFDRGVSYWSRDKVTDPNYPNMAISVYYADAPGYPANHIANSWDNINTEYNVRCIKSGESF